MTIGLEPQSLLQSGQQDRLEEMFFLLAGKAPFLLLLTRNQREGNYNVKVTDREE